MEARDVDPGDVAGPGAGHRRRLQRRRRRGRAGGHRHAVGLRGDDGARARTEPRGQGRDQHGQRAGAGGVGVPAPRAAPGLGGRARAGGGAATAGSWPRSTTCRRRSSATSTSRSSPTCSSAPTTPTAIKVVSEIVSAIPGCRPLDAGELSNATAIEAFTAVLLQLNVRYRTRVAPEADRASRPERPGAADARICASSTPPARRSSRSSPARSSRMYTCGITPYDATHLGHATVYLFYDVLQRRLRDLGHDTKCVRNVTDVDDPLFAKARELGVHYLDLAAAEEARFDRDMDALDVLPAYSTPRASSAIPDIRGFIGMVLDRGFAYQSGGVGVLRRHRGSRRFGSVSHYDEATMLAYAAERGGNVDDEHKRHPLDFVLWQPSADDEPSWETMWGPGRPGLAHRVLGAGPARAGQHDRPARRRHRPDLPPPRVRAGAVRGRHRRAVRPPLDARGHGAQGRREDVEEPGQPGLRRPAPGDVGPAGHPPGRARAPLPARAGSGTRR